MPAIILYGRFVATPSKTPPAPKALYARLPARSYQKLRRLARLPPASNIDGGNKGLLVRVPADLHEKLRRIALGRSVSSGRVVGMQCVLAELIDNAKLAANRQRRSMARVAADLIRTARAGRRNGSP
jgi:hypothetical protein